MDIPVQVEQDILWISSRYIYIYCKDNYWYLCTSYPVAKCHISIHHILDNYYGTIFTTNKWPKVKI